jgi:hypothetical protein
MHDRDGAATGRVQTLDLVLGHLLSPRAGFRNPSNAQDLTNTLSFINFVSRFHFDVDDCHGIFDADRFEADALVCVLPLR